MDSRRVSDRPGGPLECKPRHLINNRSNPHNVNIPVVYSNTTAYRIIASHAKYAPTLVNDSAANFDNCEFADNTI